METDPRIEAAARAIHLWDSDNLPLPWAEVPGRIKKRRYEQAQAALAAAADRAAWRPIEEAPKDGTSVLLYAECSHQVELLSFKEPIVLTGYWDEIDQAWCSTTSTWEGPFFEPTHFQPLPAPPTEEIE